jgi:hypothetical protein
MDMNKDWQKRVFIIGGVVGLLSGLFAAYLLVQRNNEKSSAPDITAGDGVKVGLGVLGVMKLIADMGEK